jgi:hypothetical protein
MLRFQLDRFVIIHRRNISARKKSRFEFSAKSLGLRA